MHGVRLVPDLSPPLAHVPRQWGGGAKEEGRGTRGAPAVHALLGRGGLGYDLFFDGVSMVVMRRPSMMGAWSTLAMSARSSVNRSSMSRPWSL